MTRCSIDRAVAAKTRTKCYYSAHVREKLPAYWFIIGEFAVSTLLIGYHVSCHVKVSFELASAMMAGQHASGELERSESLLMKHWK